MDLDDKDYRILGQLRGDCHISQAELGERVGLSTTAVAARVARLEKERYITGYRAYIDYKKLGYDTAALLQIRVKSTESLNLESLSDIVSMPETMNLFAMTGNYHLNLTLKARGLAELRDRITRVGRNKHISEIRTEYLVEEYKELEEFNPLPQGGNKPARQYENIKPPDELDFAILRELRLSGNMLLRELSEKLKTPISTVKERIARLERGGIIKGYVASLDFVKMGYSSYGFISIGLDIDQLDNPDIVRSLRETSEIGSLFRVFGAHDLGAGYIVKTPSDALEIVRSLSAIPGIRKVEPNTAYLKLKSKSEFNPLSGFRMPGEKK